MAVMYFVVTLAICFSILVSSGFVESGMSHLGARLAVSLQMEVEPFTLEDIYHHSGPCGPNLGLFKEECERILAAKEASLPHEPSPDNENVVTLLVRMPDGSRHGRRFMQSDQLQLLFDYIDIGRVVKHGTYRLVRPYPRCAFTVEEHGSLTLSELGLTRNETFYLEQI